MHPGQTLRTSISVSLGAGLQTQAQGVTAEPAIAVWLTGRNMTFALAGGAVNFLLNERCSLIVRGERWTIHRTGDVDRGHRGDRESRRRPTGLKTMPNSPLKKGTGSEPSIKFPAKSLCRAVPVPLFNRLLTPLVRNAFDGLSLPL